jgi:solute carrier family 35 protein F1/2
MSTRHDIEMNLGSRLATVALGQVLALLIAVTAATSTALAHNLGMTLPTVQSGLVYLMISTIYGAHHGISSFFISNKGGNENEKHIEASPAPIGWLKYAVLALLDVEANYFTVSAFRFTSVTSVTLLDSWSIPMVLVLTTFAGLATYRRGHYTGAALCIVGLIMLVATDQRQPIDGDQSMQNPILGDALVILGTTLYAGCNVLQEHLLQGVQATKVLFMLGVFGALISLGQAFLLGEVGMLFTLSWTASTVALWIGFAGAMVCFYSLVPFELRWGGAALLNLSLLSSDIWSALARLAFFGGFSVWSGAWFIVAFVFVAVGIAIYSRTGQAKRSVAEVGLPHYRSVVSEDGPGLVETYPEEGGD